MEAKVQCMLIGITPKPYDFTNKQGKEIKGTSYKATLVGGGEIFTVKTDESVYKDVGEKENLKGEAVLEITLGNEYEVPQGQYKLFLKEFNWKE